MKRALSTLAAVGLVAFGAFGAVGCRDGHYGSVDVGSRGGDMSAVLDLAEQIQINEGSAASAQVTLHAKDGDVLSGGLQPADPTILQIVSIATDANGGYVFMGVHAGTTTVAIAVNGQTVATVPAIVNAPPAFVLPAEDAGGVTVATPEAGAGDAGIGDASDSG